MRWPWIAVVILTACGAAPPPLPSAARSSTVARLATLTRPANALQEAIDRRFRGDGQPAYADLVKAALADGAQARLVAVAAASAGASTSAEVVDRQAVLASRARILSDWFQELDDASKGDAARRKELARVIRAIVEANQVDAAALGAPDLRQRIDEWSKRAAALADGATTP